MAYGKENNRSPKEVHMVASAVPDVFALTDSTRTIHKSRTVL